MRERLQQTRATRVRGHSILTYDSVTHATPPMFGKPRPLTFSLC